MKIIIISGPSGSGKTTLSKEILKEVKNGFIINTDNYYKTGLISKILSKFVKSYFDKILSFNINLFKKDLEFIYKNGFANYEYIYDFKDKFVRKKNISVKNINFLIIEGIFVNELLNYFSQYKCLLIILKIKKYSCFKRAIKRDMLERGKNKNIAINDFLNSWDLYKQKQNLYNYNLFNEYLIFKERPNLDLIIKKLTN